MVFCTQQLKCASRVVLRMFLTFLIFEPKWRFCKGCSLCMLANFGHFGNVVIFQILGFFFLEVFCTQQFECASRVVLPMFLTILIFEPRWRFCNGYSLCMVANFGHFGIVVIFRILGVFFWRSFLHPTI